MDHYQEVLEEVWMFKETVQEPCLEHTGTEVRVPPAANADPSSVDLEPRPKLPSQEGPHYVIVFNCGPAPLRPLRLDWRKEGLHYREGGLHPKEEVKLKIFDAPIPARDLLGYLKSVETRVFDELSFNSKHFCEELFEAFPGVEE
eukprot:CAMPEP_0206531708 /NCGR_PEP_ID=MMETSP0325_2-20121206/3923_1 /ASSEMBLY_ACC=CAM_ASM_000347 /TAXON_ID=2866 /ORGANISM="Crypthecodinium cohnii, Strain Seligo" /LENGTH=144 /DNA_ID=CAMNT_0054027997 /DNA_START=127 /DNA_END=558 /DNA_ORIENTATION=+